MLETTIKNSTILVTGGAGFIGSNLCEILLKQGNKVRCLDNFATGHKYNLASFIDNTNFELIEGDIRNIEDCRKAVDGVDYVLHQAALGSVPRSIVDPITTNDVNIGGFVKMLFAAQEAKVKRFVYAASSSTYGDQPDLPKQEHIIGNPLSPYAITKYVDELYAKNFSDLYKIETIGLRYFNVFGKRQDPNGSYAAVIPKFVSQLLAHTSPVINGDGSFSRDFTYIENVIQANQLAAITPAAVIRENAKVFYQQAEINSSTISEVFNVAYGERTSLNELITMLKERLAISDPSIAEVQVLHRENRVGDVPHSLASINKAKAILGYKPAHSVSTGLLECTDWYRDFLAK